MVRSPKPSNVALFSIYLSSGWAILINAFALFCKDNLPILTTAISVFVTFSAATDHSTDPPRDTYPPIPGMDTGNHHYDTADSHQINKASATLKGAPGYSLEA